MICKLFNDTGDTEFYRTIWLNCFFLRLFVLISKQFNLSCSFTRFTWGSWADRLLGTRALISFFLWKINRVHLECYLKHSISHSTSSRSQKGRNSLKQFALHTKRQLCQMQGERLKNDRLPATIRPWLRGRESDNQFDLSVLDSETKWNWQSERQLRAALRESTG